MSHMHCRAHTAEICGAPNAGCAAVEVRWPRWVPVRPPVSGSPDTEKSLGSWVGPWSWAGGDMVEGVHTTSRLGP